MLFLILFCKFVPLNDNNLKYVSMYKLTKTITLLLAAMLVVASCSKDAVSSVSTSDESEALEVQLSTYNSNLKSTQTRGWWGRFLQIVCADAQGAFEGCKAGASVGAICGDPATGAIVGGVVYGAAASFKCASELGENQGSSNLGNMNLGQPDKGSPADSTSGVASIENEDLFAKSVAAYQKIRRAPVVDDDNVEMILPEEYVAISTTIASLHNTMLETMGSLPSNLEDLDVECFTEEEQQIISSPEFREGFNNMIQEQFDYTTYQPTSRVGQILKLFFNAVQQGASSIDNLKQITNDYILIIEGNSELTDSEKRTLYSAFAVAVYSYSYWSHIYNPSVSTN